MQRSDSHRSGGGARLVMGPRGLTLAAVTVVLLIVGSASAKEKKPVTRTISGVVLDPAENGITGAGVELTDLRTGKQVAIFAEQGGLYQFTDLDPGDDYQIQASFKNQTSEARKITSLTREMKVVINLHIPPPKSE